MAKTQELYQASLEKGWQETKSFDINKLFLVGFFGGVIPLIVLGRMNARWLNVSLKKIYPMIVLGIILIIGKFILLRAVLEGSLPIETRDIKFGYKLGCIIMYFYLKYLLKKPFQQHMVTNGETEPLLKTAMYWVVIGIGIELIVLMISMSGL